MRWLMIALFVSVVALLVISAGVARHIRREHAQQQEPRTEEETGISTEEGQ